MSLKSRHNRRQCCGCPDRDRVAGHSACLAGGFPLYSLLRDRRGQRVQTVSAKRSKRNIFMPGVLVCGKKIQVTDRRLAPSSAPIFRDYDRPPDSGVMCLTVQKSHCRFWHGFCIYFLFARAYASQQILARTEFCRTSNVRRPLANKMTPQYPFHGYKTQS